MIKGVLAFLIIVFGLAGIDNCVWAIRLRMKKGTKRPSVVLWLPVFMNGQTVPGHITRPIVDYGVTDRDFALKLWKNPDRLLRLELDSETLDVISARTEKP